MTLHFFQGRAARGRSEKTPELVTVTGVEALALPRANWYVGIVRLRFGGHAPTRGPPSSLDERGESVGVKATPSLAARLPQDEGVQPARRYGQQREHTLLEGCGKYCGCGNGGVSCTPYYSVAARAAYHTPGGELSGCP